MARTKQIPTKMPDFGRDLPPNYQTPPYIDYTEAQKAKRDLAYEKSMKRLEAKKRAEVAQKKLDEEKEERKKQAEELKQVKEERKALPKIAREASRPRASKRLKNKQAPKPGALKVVDGTEVGLKSMKPSTHLRKPQRQKPVAPKVVGQAQAEKEDDISEVNEVNEVNDKLSKVKQAEYDEEEEIHGLEFPTYTHYDNGLPPPPLLKLACHKICARFPNALQGPFLDRFLDEGWSSKRMYENCPVNVQKAIAKKTKYPEQYFSRRLLARQKKRDDLKKIE